MSFDQLCINNQPVGGTQTFKIKAKFRIETISILKDLIIHDDAACNVAPVSFNYKDYNQTVIFRRMTLFI